MEWLTKINDFLSALRAGAGVAADTVRAGADALKNLADFLESFAGGAVFTATPDQDAQVDVLLAEAVALRASPPVMATGPVGAVNPMVILMLLDLVIKALEIWRNRKN